MEGDTKIELTEKEKEFVAKIAELEQAKENMTSEIIELRKRKETEAAPQIKEEPNKVTDTVDPKKVVLEVLTQREQEQVKKNFEQAKEDIKKIIRDLSPDVDQGGILFTRFERELSKFKMDDLTTKEDFIERFKEAYRLMDTTRKSGNKVDFYAGADMKGADVKVEDGSQLSAKEMGLVQELGWTKEQYLKQKSKRPTYIATLLRYR